METLFELLERGVMKDKMTGARVFVISRNGWRSFHEELESTFSGTAPVILERIGYAYGKMIGRGAKRMGLDTEKTFEALFELAAGAGWGSMYLSGGNLAQGRGILKVKYCVFCDSLKGRDVDGCHFLPGVTRGVADEVTGKPHNAVERACVCKGFPGCEIHIDLVGPA